MMSLHNVTFFLRLMRSAREAIAAGAYVEFKKETLADGQSSVLSDQ
jgi:queuine/archaeosine tRNA-ribosyltransferase